MSGSPEQKRSISGPLRTIAQVARRLSVSRDTVVGYYESGELPGADMSVRGKGKKRALRFRDDDVDRLEEKRFREAIAGAEKPRRRRAGN